MLDEPICGLDDIERAGDIRNIGFCKLKLKRFGSLDALKRALQTVRAHGMALTIPSVIRRHQYRRASKPFAHVDGGVVLTLANETSNGVQRVEQEMRVELHELASLDTELLGHGSRLRHARAESGRRKSRGRIPSIG